MSLLDGYNGLVDKYGKYLTKAQKNQLKNKAAQVSLETTGASRLEAQTSALQTRKSTNEMLSNYGLASNLQTRPQSGIDEAARRMPGLKSSMNRMEALDTAALGNEAAKMAAQTRARRAKDAAERQKLAERAKFVESLKGYNLDPRQGQALVQAWEEDYTNGDADMTKTSSVIKYVNNEMTERALNNALAPAKERIRTGAVPAANIPAARTAIANKDTMLASVLTNVPELTDAQYQALMKEYTAANTDNDKEDVVNKWYSGVIYMGAVAKTLDENDPSFVQYDADIANAISQGIASHDVGAVQAALHTQSRRGMVSTGEQILSAAEAGSINLSPEDSDNLRMAIESGNVDTGWQVIAKYVPQMNENTEKSLREAIDVYMHAGIVDKNDFVSINKMIAQGNYEEAANAIGQYRQGATRQSIIAACEGCETYLASVSVETFDGWMAMSGEELLNDINKPGARNEDEIKVKRTIYGLKVSEEAYNKYGDSIKAGDPDAIEAETGVFTKGVGDNEYRFKSGGLYQSGFEDQDFDFDGTLYDENGKEYTFSYGLLESIDGEAVSMTDEEYASYSIPGALYKEKNRAISSDFDVAVARSAYQAAAANRRRVQYETEIAKATQTPESLVYVEAGKGVQIEWENGAYKTENIENRDMAIYFDMLCNGDSFSGVFLTAEADRNKSSAYAAKEVFDLMEPEDVQYYLYMKGQYGAEGAEMAMNFLDTFINERAYNKERSEYLTWTTEFREAARANPAYWLALPVYDVVFGAATVATLPMRAWGGLYNIAMTVAGKDIDPYSKNYSAIMWADTVRGEIGESTKESLGGGLFGSIACWTTQVIFSAADSAFAAMIGGSLGGALGSTTNTIAGIATSQIIAQVTTLPLFGLSAAASTTRDALIAGATQTQAKELGFFAGLSEMLFEIVSLDKLVTMDPSDFSTLGKALVNLAGMGAIEGSEEICTDLANNLANAVIMGGLSDTQKNITEYMSNGYGYAAASSMAVRDRYAGYIMSFLAGAVSGGFSSVGRMAQLSLSKEGFSETGKQIRQAGGIETLAERASESDMPSLRKAGLFLRNAIAAGTKVSNMRLGAIAYTLYEHEVSTKIETITDTVKELVKDGTISGKVGDVVVEIMERLYRTGYDDQMFRDSDLQKLAGRVSTEQVVKVLKAISEKLGWSEQNTNAVLSGAEAMMSEAKSEGKQSVKAQKAAKKNAAEVQEAAKAGGIKGFFASRQAAANAAKEANTPAAARALSQSIRQAVLLEKAEENVKQAEKAAAAKEKGAIEYANKQADAAVSVRNSKSGRNSDQANVDNDTGKAEENRTEAEPGKPGTQSTSAERSSRVSEAVEGDLESLNKANKLLGGKEKSVKLISADKMSATVRSVVAAACDIAQSNVSFYDIAADQNMHGVTIGGKCYVAYSWSYVEAVFQAMHETCERSKYYKAFAHKLVETLAAQRGETGMQEILESYKDMYGAAADGMTEAELMNELVCDMFGAYMTYRTTGENVFGQIADFSQEETELIGSRFEAAVDAYDRDSDVTAEAGVQFSTRAIKPTQEEYDEYMVLAKKYVAGDATDADKARLRELVTKQQEYGGYVQRVYHGNPSFGFTDIDVTKGKYGLAMYAAGGTELSKYYAGIRAEETSEIFSIEERANSMKEAIKSSIEKLKGGFVQQASTEAIEVLDIIKKAGPKFDGIEMLTKENVKSLPDYRKSANHIIDQSDLLEEYASKYGFKGISLTNLLNKLFNRKGDIYPLIGNTIEKLSTFRQLVDEKADIEDYKLDFLSDSFDSLKSFASEHIDEQKAVSDLDEIVNSAKEYIEEFRTYKNAPFKLNKTIMTADDLALSLSNTLTELENGKKRGIYDLVAKPGNQFVIEGKNNKWNEFSTPEEMYADTRKAKSSTRDVERWAAGKYDSVLVNDIYDGDTKPSDVYEFFSNSALKSNDLVTVDKDGNIIPLEDRFRSDRTGEEAWKNNSLLYSKRSLTRAIGLDLVKQEDGTYVFTKNGKPIQGDITADMVKKSAMGALIHAATEEGRKKLLKDVGHGKNDVNLKAVGYGAQRTQIIDEERQLQGYADLLNMIKKTQNPDMVWAYAGSELFAGFKSNSDHQYSTTIDFTTVCRKTVEIIHGISVKAVSLGRGLSKDEIITIQKSINDIGGTVPCPVCYVFSRWAGIGSILNNMKSMQDKYANYTYEEMQQAMEKLDKTLDDRRKKKGYLQNDEYFSALVGEQEKVMDRIEKLEAKVGKGITPEEEAELKEKRMEAARIEVEIAPCEEFTWLQNVRTKPEYKPVPSDILFNLEDAGTFAAQYPDSWKYRCTRGPSAGKAILPYSDMRLGDMILGTKYNSARDTHSENKDVIVGKNTFTLPGKMDVEKVDRIVVNGEQIKEASYSMVGDKKVYDKSQEGTYYKVSESKSGVTTITLFKSKNGKESAYNPPQAIDSDGDPKVNATKKPVFSVRWTAFGTGNTMFQNTAKADFSKQQERAIVSAIAKTRAQNLIGGVRFQSTSDFRYEYALDYIQTFIEAQALGASMQTYTKIIEFADMCAAVGGDCNLSLMPRNDGYVYLTGHTELKYDPKTGEYTGGNLVFSSVTGIDAQEAINTCKKAGYDSVQTILVGVNDNHIRLALSDSGDGVDVGFVIPFHASGASIEDFTAKLIENLGETYVKGAYQDYSDVQRDTSRYGDFEVEDEATGKKKKIKGEKLPESIKNARDLRTAILTSNEKFMDEHRAILDEFLTLKNVDISAMSFEELRAIELKALAGDQESINKYVSWSQGIIGNLYNKLIGDKTASTWGIKLSGDQAEGIMPHEYWDTGTTRENAYVNGFIFRSYCYSLGYNPRFTGIKNGNVKTSFGDFSDCRGYWKTLIDRPMYAKVYGEDGSFKSYMGPYRAQNTITMNVTMTDMADPNVYKSQHEVTVKEPSTRNAEDAVWLSNHDINGIKEHVKEKFGAGKETLKEWVEAAMQAERANPGISTEDLYARADAAMAKPKFSTRGLTSDEDIREMLRKNYLNSTGVELTGVALDFYVDMFKAYEEYSEGGLTAESYYSAYSRWLEKYQSGKADKDTFFKDTIARFTRKSRRPNSAPDYVSYNKRGEVSSEYWYTNEGVIRGSNHWGMGIRSCDWFLEDDTGHITKGAYDGIIKTNMVYGFCSWGDFIYKPDVTADGTGVTSLESESAGSNYSTRTVKPDDTVLQAIREAKKTVSSLRSLVESGYYDKVRESLNNIEKERAEQRAAYSREIARRDAQIRSRDKKLATTGEELKTAKKDLISLKRKAVAQDAEIKDLKVGKRMAVLKERARIEEKANKEKYTKDVLSKVKDLRKWMYDSPKPDQLKHVPDIMKGAVMAAIEMVDPGHAPDATFKNGNARPTSKDVMKYRASIEQMREDITKYLLSKQDQGENAEENPEMEQFLASLPSGFIDSLNKITEATAETGKLYLADMTSDQVRAALIFVASVKHAVMDANKLYASSRYQSIAELGEATIAEAEKSKHRRQFANQAVASLDKFINTQMLDAYSIGHSIGKTGEEIIDLISKGYFNSTDLVLRSQERMSEIKEANGITSKDTWKWSEDDNEFTLDSGKTIHLTTAQIMSLYNASFRLQAMNHILSQKGGIYTGRTKAAINAGITSTRFAITENDLDTILDTLTDKQKTVAREMQQFLATECAAWGNEVTQTLYLIDGYGEENYWPIDSSEFQLAQKDPAKQQAFNAAINPSFANALVRRANNAITINDAFDVYTGHSAQMANYRGIGIPLQDLMKWLNYRSRTQSDDGKWDIDPDRNVKAALESLSGPNTRTFLVNLIKDLNGLSSGNVTSGLIDALAANTKRAEIAGKIRVFIQQPTAVLRATAFIDPKYFAGMPHFNVKETVTEMQAHSAVARWKANGNYEIGIGRSMRSMIVGARTLDALTDAAMSPAGAMDNLGWSWIWNAVKREVSATTGLKEGDEGFFEAVDSRFTQVVNETQVIDTPLHRSQLMRSKDTGVRNATSFMSEPTKMYNMLRNSIVMASRMGKAAGIRRVSRTLFAILLSNAVNALVTSLYDAGRKREDNDEERFMYSLWETYKSNLLDSINPFSNIAYVKDIYAILTGGDPSERMEFSALSDVVQAYTRAFKRVTSGESKYTDYYIYSSLVKATSDMLGLPVGGVASSLEAVANMIVPQLTRAKKPTDSEAKKSEVEKAARAAGMSIRDFYEAWDTIKGDKVEDKASALLGLDLTDEQKIAMAPRVSDALPDVLERRTGECTVDQAIEWYAKKATFEKDDVLGTSTHQFQQALLMDMSLTPQQKQDIYRTVTGNKKLLDFSSSLALDLSTGDYKPKEEKAESTEPYYSTDYKRAEKATAAGISMETWMKYSNLKTQYGNDDDDGTSKTTICEAIMADTSLTPAQKTAMERSLYEDLEPKVDPKTGKVKAYTPRDYSSSDWFYVSGTDYVNKTKLATQKGVPVATCVKYLKLYEANKGKGGGKNGAYLKKDYYYMMTKSGIPKAKQDVFYGIMKGTIKK